MNKVATMSLSGSMTLKHSEILKCLAKSGGTTIGEHNNSLYEQLNILTNYGILGGDTDGRLLNLLSIAIKYHDYGKANIDFQNKVANKSHNERLYHHLISPVFYLIDKYTNVTDEDKLVLYSIIHHHSREPELLESPNIDINNNKLKILLSEIKDRLIGINSIDETTYKNIINKYLNLITKFQRLEKSERKRDLVLLTGFLVRIDHAASGELDVEQEPIKEDRVEILKRYFVRTGKPGKLRAFQEKFGISNKKDYQCVVADTGLGKTGLSVLWSNRKKFYILPNRASVNAMYQTLSDIYGKDNVGLLHSTALSYLIGINNDDISAIKDYEQTKVLSKPVTVCTADQLFTAAFNMPGYEKIYATLSYSDIIIDEIQGFQPQQIIPIIKQIKETKELGARYLIITATLPEIVAEKLRGIGFDVITDDIYTIDSVKRHRIKIVDKTIDALTEDIISKYKQNKKVLVVVNTVRKAQEIYDKLKTAPNIKVHILHSRFIWRDRGKKEKDVLEECKQDEDCNYINKHGCIWVATQLVEASLDIDFDCLFTEAATADSLIQRMGRVWRHRKSDYIGEENIIIASDVEYRIYEESLTRQSIEKIYNKLQNGYLTSIDKREIVKEIYNKENLRGSKYLKEWKEFEDQINSGWKFISDEKAQVAFRDVMTVEMIPAIYEKKIAGLVDELNRINDDSALDRKQRKLRRAEILKQIQEYKVPVPIYWLTSYAKRHNISIPYKVIDKDYNISLLNSYYEYKEEKGLTGKVNEVDDFEDRCF